LSQILVGFPRIVYQELMASIKLVRETYTNMAFPEMQVGHLEGASLRMLVPQLHAGRILAHDQAGENNNCGQISFTWKIYYILEERQ
jgi:hypothetical protein